MTRVLIYAALLAAPSISWAHSRLSERIDSVDAYIARVMVERQVPGVAVAVMRNGVAVLTSRTVFPSGSG
jgi:hypothetical protein